MAFGFGSGDFGFSEGNPFGLFGSRGRSGPQTFNVGEGLSQSPQARQSRGRVLGINASRNFTPAPNQSIAPIGPQPLPAPVSASRPRTSNVITPPPQGNVPAPSGATNTASLTSTQKPEEVDQSLAEQQQIDELFGGTANFLNSLQQSLEGDLDRTLGVAGSQFDAQRNFLDDARNELITQNTAQQEGEKKQARNALDEAKLLFSELGQANRQRFGGTSSAGDFANAIQGREFQRSQNRIQQTSAANLQSLRDKASSINQNYQSNLTQLEAQKTAALNDIQSQFNQRLQQIDAQRTLNQQQKAEAKLEALRQVRADAQAIEDQKSAFQQQLEAQTLAAAQNVFAAVQSFRAEQGQPVDLASLPGAQFSTLLGGQATADQQLPQGFFRRPDTSGDFLPQGLFRPEQV